MVKETALTIAMMILSQAAEKAAEIAAEIAAQRVAQKAAEEATGIIVEEAGTAVERAAEIDIFPARTDAILTVTVEAWSLERMNYIHTATWRIYHVEITLRNRRSHFGFHSLRVQLYYYRCTTRKREDWRT
jgi:hypothetical protein